MTKRLRRAESAATGVKRRPKGWSLDRRLRQAELIRRWHPWRLSTGPKTVAGKACAATNALKHGLRSRDHIEIRRCARQILRLAAANLKRIKAFLHAPTCASIKYKLRVPRTVMRIERDKPFRPQSQERRMSATHCHATGEDHRWP